MELASKYNPTDIEAKWYQYWLDNSFFKSTPDGRKPYTVVIPPPMLPVCCIWGICSTIRYRISLYAVRE